MPRFPLEAIDTGIDVGQGRDGEHFFLGDQSCHDFPVPGMEGKAAEHFAVVAVIDPTRPEWRSIVITGQG